MINALAIRDLGVIANAELSLQPGFTAITGETGAGKTMVVTALGLLLGGRAASTVVRGGTEKAVVEGRVELDADSALAALVNDAGGEIEPFDDASGTTRGELLLSRQVLGSGRSRAWLGGQSVPVGRLAQAGELLVAVHGQSDQLRLAREPAQREALDAFGGDPLARAFADYQQQFSTVTELREQLTNIRSHAAERADERARLLALSTAVDEVQPVAGEDAELLARIERISNREALREDIGVAHARLAGESRPGGSLREEAREVQTAIERALRNDPSLERAHEGVIDLAYAVDDLAMQLAGYLDDLEAGGVGELETLNARLQQLEDLKRLVGGDLDAVLSAQTQAGLRLLELGNDDETIPQLEADLDLAQAALEAAAADLHRERAAAAERLSTVVSEELHALAMPHARLCIRVERNQHPVSHGDDHISFELSPHPGADALPLERGASGGELSRVMLALEVALAGANPVPTLVFDEIDAGVGGAAALEIGRRLQRLARTSQVLVVTHLAQVAAFADHHVVIEKSVDGEVTTSAIRELDASARVEELARLLSGLAESSSGRAHATELLDLAGRASEPHASATIS